MTTPLQVAEAYFDAWSRNDPAALGGVLADDVVVHGPLGRLDGAATYRHSLARIFGITDWLVLRRRWVDGNHVMSWLVLHPLGSAEPFPVASWLTVTDGRVAEVNVTFDLTKLLAAGDPRRHDASGER